MKKGKLIVLEGTDCSGKETQSNLLKDKLIKDGYKVFKTSFPMYDTPTGKIVGGPLLGKTYICESWFNDAPNLDPLVTSCYFAADRKFNINIIIDYLNKGYIVLLDRYVESNMAFQGGKEDNKNNRLKLYKKIDELEFGIMELPRPDKIIFLYMPYKQACILKAKRNETPDVVEKSEMYLKRGEKAYLELAKLYHYDQVNCTNKDNIRSIESINDEVYKKVKEYIDEY
jgi:dTMP kinase